MQNILDWPPINTLSHGEFPSSLKFLTNPPKKLFYCGAHATLQNLLYAKHRVAIVGTRRPNPYTRSFVATLATQIVKHNGVVISGGAVGVDIVAHTYAIPRTIMVSPSSLDIIYPKSNAKIIKQIMKEALVLSEYESPYRPHRYSFLERNRLIIALSEYVVIPQADLMSGSMQSARLAQELKKPLFVLPHRIGESEGTNMLLAQRKAEGIYNLSNFIFTLFGENNMHIHDEVLAFCAKNPSFEEAYNKFGEKIYEYELEGRIIRESGKVRVL